MSADFFPQRDSAAFWACSRRWAGVSAILAAVALAAFKRAAAILAGVRARPIAAAAFERAAVVITL
jgi:hypothetical protein